MPVMTKPDAFEMIDIDADEPCYFEALRNMPFPVLLVCEDGRLLMANLAFQTATGLSHEDVPTIDRWSRHVMTGTAKDGDLAMRSLMAPDNPPNTQRLIIKTAAGQRLVWELFVSPMGRTRDDRRLNLIVASDVTQATEHERHLEATTHRLEREVLDKTADLNATIDRLEREIADRKRTAEALTRSRERLKDISRRTLNVLEADRRTVSKELHDGIGASLAAIKFSLEEKEMSRENGKGRLDQTLNQEIAYLLAAIKETKRISANLRPTTLDDLGLMATIDWYLRQFQRMVGNIRVDYRTDLMEKDVPEMMKIIIYRIIQEGLSNTQKHSEATSVILHMGFSDGKRSISIIIEDDGRGFDVDEVFSRKDPLSGYGLTAMRERCEIFGGSFHIASYPGQGTRINAILPT